MVGSVLSSAVSIGTSVIGGLQSAKAAKKAANIQSQSTDRAIAEQRRQTDQARTDQGPFLDAGQKAQFHIDYLQGRVSDGYTREEIEALVNPTQEFGYLNQTYEDNGQYKDDPAYGRRLEEGQQAIERSAAARGGLLSGATTKRLNEFAQNMASDEYARAYNRFVSDQTNLYNSLAGQAGLGQQTAQQLTVNDRAATNQIGEFGTQGANARASGVIGANNAWQSGLQGAGSGLSNFFASKAFKRFVGE